MSQYPQVRYLQFGKKSIELSEKTYTYRLPDGETAVQKGDLVLAGKREQPALVVDFSDEEPKAKAEVILSNTTLSDYLTIDEN